MGKLGYTIIALVTLTFTTVSVNELIVILLGWGKDRRRESRGIQPSGENSECQWRQPVWLLVGEVFGGLLISCRLAGMNI